MGSTNKKAAKEKFNRLEVKPDSFPRPQEAKRELDLDAVICSSRFGIRWSQSVMGVWENASSSTATSTSKGVLVLYEKGSQVIGISTTTDSAWEGHFSNGILTATYVNKYNITGSLRLTLSSNGSTLYGTWTSGTESGTYEAARSPKVENTPSSHVHQ